MSPTLPTTYFTSPFKPSDDLWPTYNLCVVPSFCCIKLIKKIFSQPPDDPSLTPPLTVLDHAQILRDIMTVYQSSMVDDEDANELQAGFSKVLDIMVDPVVEACANASEKKKHLRSRWDQAVFMLNCLSYLLVGNVFTHLVRGDLTCLVTEHLGAIFIHISETRRRS